jgi:DNA-binding transcriptional LysR family regulator
MNINSSQLQAFFAIAKLLSFTKAAEALHVTQSALSQRIARLEEDLETTLFIRDRSFVRLTEAGEQVLRYCQINDNVESELLSKLKSSKNDFSGILRIGGFSSINRSLVIPAMKKMMMANERLSIHLITRELQDLDKLLKSVEVDYIITNKKSESDDIQSIFLGHEENVLVKSKNFTDNNVFLDHDASVPTTKSYFKQNKLNIKPLTMRYLDDVYGLIDGVKNGYGKAILPLHLIKNEKDLEVIESKRILTVPVYLQFYIQAYYRSVHTLFVSEMKSYFQKHLRQKG